MRGHGRGLVEGLEQLQAGRVRVLHERVVGLEVVHLAAGARVKAFGLARGERARSESLPSRKVHEE